MCDSLSLCVRFWLEWGLSCIALLQPSLTIVCSPPPPHLLCLRQTAVTNMFQGSRGPPLRLTQPVTPSWRADAVSDKAWTVMSPAVLTDKPVICDLQPAEESMSFCCGTFICSRRAPHLFLHTSPPFKTRNKNLWNSSAAVLRFYHLCVHHVERGPCWHRPGSSCGLGVDSVLYSGANILWHLQRRQFAKCTILQNLFKMLMVVYSTLQLNITQSGNIIVSVEINFDVSGCQCTVKCKVYWLLITEFYLRRRLWWLFFTAQFSNVRKPLIPLCFIVGFVL